MQEYRKILADRPVAQCRQFLRPRADDHPVALMHGQAQQFIANRTADEEDLHGGSVVTKWRG